MLWSLEEGKESDFLGFWLRAKAEIWGGKRDPYQRDFQVLAGALFCRLFTFSAQLMF